MQQAKTILISAIAFSVALSASGAPVCAQDNEELDRLREIKQEIGESKSRQGDIKQEAITLTRELRAAAKRLVTLASQVQNREEAVNGLEEKVTRLAAEEATHQAVFSVRRAELARTLGALERLSQHPPALALVRPDDAVNVVRSAGLVMNVLPKIRAQADEIRGTLDDLREVREVLEIESDSLSTQLAALNSERLELEVLKKDHQERRQALFEQSQEERRLVARLALEAKDIAGLMTRIAKEVPRPRTRPEATSSLPPVSPTTKPAPRSKPTPPVQKFGAARGALALPARGKLVQGFGDQTKTGHARGLRIMTRAGAQVVAPYDGRLVFAGPFRDYGQLLIIEHSDGYHTLLAGMERLEVNVGQPVVSGEPVGVMGQRTFTGGGQSPVAAGPQLYVELRRNGEPINPMPWLSARLGKRG